MEFNCYLEEPGLAKTGAAGPFSPGLFKIRAIWLELQINGFVLLLLENSNANKELKNKAI